MPPERGKFRSTSASTPLPIRAAAVNERKHRASYESIESQFFTVDCAEIAEDIEMFCLVLSVLCVLGGE